VSTNKKINKDVRFNVRLLKKEREIYKSFCKNKNITISKRLRELILLDIQGKICQEN
jgi:hypothetical protein